MNEQLVVATYNIEMGAEPRQLLDNISELSRSAGIICLQEVIEYPEDPFILDATLERLDDSWDSAHHLGSLETDEDGKGHGVALLWNKNQLDLQNVRRLDLPKMDSLSSFAYLAERAVGFAGAPVQRRAITGTYADTSGSTIAVTSLHLDSMGGPENRYGQARHVLNDLNAQPGIARSIIAGDFNTNSIRHPNEERETLRDIFSAYGYTEASETVTETADMARALYGPSRPKLAAMAQTIGLRASRKLDYVWARGLQTIDSWNLPRTGSDHLPLVARMENAAITDNNA